MASVEARTYASLLQLRRGLQHRGKVQVGLIATALIHHLTLPFLVQMGSLVAGQEFQHILRLLNTNVDGKEKVMYALTAIRGIGRRFSNVACKKAEVDMKKRAGGCCCSTASECIFACPWAMHAVLVGGFLHSCLHRCRRGFQPSGGTVPAQTAC